MRKRLGLLVAAVLLFSINIHPAGALPMPTCQLGVSDICWNLSGDVMPVPPYGSADIPGSDTLSKLAVYQPVYNSAATQLHGVMVGLHPLTKYTVYLSQGYTPYEYTGWDLTGDWGLSFEYMGGYYDHAMTLTQSGGTLSGSGGYPAAGPFTYTWVVTSGSVTGNNVDFYADYTASADAVTPQTTMHVLGTIAPDGSMSGTWADNYQGGNRAGTWSTTSGPAITDYTGDTTWPGLYNPAVQSFTFKTNKYGIGFWQYYLKSSKIAGPLLSVWVNEGGNTVLISDTIQLY